MSGTASTIKSLKKRVKELEEQVEEFISNSKKWVRSEMTDWFRVEEQPISYDSMFLGLVVSTEDPWKYNRVKFFCPVLHSRLEVDVEQLPWAWPVSNQGGFDDSGCTWVPPAGSVIIIIFEAGNRDSAYYLGTTWQRDRTKYLSDMQKYSQKEYDKIWRGHRGGYLVGPDETQVFPPWNTANYHGYDIDSIKDFQDNPQAAKQITYPHLHGWKTPEKHMIQMDDGDKKCFHRWKRMLFQSSLGHLLLFKDDNLHPCGEWLNPSGGAAKNPPPQPSAAVQALSALAGGIGLFVLLPPSVSSAQAQPSAAATDQGESGYPDGQVCKPSGCINPWQEPSFCSRSKPCKPKDKYQKHISEKPAALCKRCWLDQSGILLLSRSGAGLVFDDSTELPRAKEPRWEEGQTPFDYDGCTGRYKGKVGLMSGSGHYLEMNDTEDVPTRRSEMNGIRLHTASGIDFFMCDHDDGSACRAGKERGVHLRTSSNHTFDFVDYGANTCSPPRECGGIPNPDADKAYVKLRTGYGLYLMMDDQTDQKNTTKQYIELCAWQKDNKKRGPHLLRMQERPESSAIKPMIYLRAGGEYFFQSYDDRFEMIGVPKTDDDPGNKANKVEIITRHKVVYCFEDYLNKAKRHIFLADKAIYLLAGKDHKDPQTGKCGPAAFPVVVAMRGIPKFICDLFGIKASERVFASAIANCEGKPDDGCPEPEEEPEAEGNA